MTNVVELPRGFRTAGSTCGIKESGRPDLAVFVSDVPAAAAGVFTQNRVCGAPVIVSRQRVPAADARAVVINSGNSNACTGEQGIADARAMTAALAAALGCQDEQVLVCSTGVIGVPLPIARILGGLPAAAAGLGTDPEHLLQAATAMMTTDTFPKLASRYVALGSGKSARVTGVAKGAAMISPNMATMLSVIMTDARLTADQAGSLLKSSAAQTFNCISVDGHTSTSDTVLLLANGAAMPAAPTDAELSDIGEALTEVSRQLAMDIIRDAEGASHFITVRVTGLSTTEDARRMARAICDSALVKTAIAGADPNWGRIVSAAGYAGVPFETQHVTLRINTTVVYEGGVPVPFDAQALSAEMRNQREVDLTLAVTGGPASGSEAAQFWTSDLTTEYVRLNSDYTT